MLDCAARSNPFVSLGINSLDIKIHLEPNAVMPVVKTSGSAGADLCAALPEGSSITLLPGETAIVDTGVRVELPSPALAIFIQPRSGLACPPPIGNQLTVGNSPGLIDYDFTGTLKVILHNEGKDSYTVLPGERIAQMFITFNLLHFFSLVPAVINRSTERGEGGLGSTGN